MESSITETIQDLKIDVVSKKIITYCEICTLPIEYCSIAHPIMIKRKDLSIFGAKQEEIKEESKEEIKKDEEKPKTDDESKKLEEAKTDENKKTDEEKKEEAPKKKKVDVPRVVIEESKRGKKKHITYVMNLEKFGINLKDTSKLLSKKCACSATVTKEDNGQEVITLTGEFAVEIQEFLLLKFPTILKEKDFKILLSNK